MQTNFNRSNLISCILNINLKPFKTHVRFILQTNASYQFGFDVNDDENTNYQNRKEQREGGKISGSYSVVDSDGFIRTVTYTADPKEGFKAEVITPTNIST